MTPSIVAVLASEEGNVGAAQTPLSVVDDANSIVRHHIHQTRYFGPDSVKY